MSFSLAEAVVFFRGDDSKLSSDLGSAEKKTESSAANMAKFLGGAIVGGAAIAGAAILAIGGKAWDVASDLDAATDQIGASLGLSADKAKGYGQVIKNVYGNNFGNSIADVGKAVENVAKQLKLTADDPALKTITENAFRLRDVFEVDVNESIDAVKTLMENFGVTSEEAFDLLATGYERGLDSSGDFLDTIGEYSTQFANGGSSASMFFKVMEEGNAGGILGTDKAADAFKEFGIRILDNSTLTKTSLEGVGISYDELTQGFQDGSKTQIDAMFDVLYQLGQIEDPIERARIGVGLFGTQWEDLGEDAMLALGQIEEGFGAQDGAILKLDTKYTNLGSAAEGMWRKFQVGIAPAGEAMLGFVNDNLPAIQEVIDGVSTVIVDFINDIPVAIADMRTKWDEDWAGIRSTWTEFATEMPREHEEFWNEWNRTFNAGSDENRTSWEDFFNGLNTFATSWWRLTVENWTLSLTMIRGIWQTFTNVFQGEWQASWDGFALALGSVTDIMLNMIEFGFGPGLRDAIAGALNGAWDVMKEIFETVERWWGNSWGRLLGGTLFESSMPDLGVFNPQNAPQSNSQQFLNDLNLGVNGSSFGGLQSQAQGSSYNFGSINVNVGQDADPYQAGKSVGQGIQDELRTRGF